MFHMCRSCEAWQAWHRVRASVLRDMSYGDKFDQLLQTLKQVKGQNGPAKTIVFANSKGMATRKNTKETRADGSDGELKTV